MACAEHFGKNALSAGLLEDITKETLSTPYVGEVKGRWEACPTKASNPDSQQDQRHKHAHTGTAKS